MIDALLTELAAALRSRDQRLDALDQQLADVRGRLDVAERQPGVRFCGPWRDGQTYQRGDIVQRQSSLFIALRTCTPSDIPTVSGVRDEDDGPAHAPWRIVSRRGKDAPTSLERRVQALEDRL